MPELQARDAKLIQYLNEAYGKERELETSLSAHIRMTTRAPYKNRLEDHLRETKAQTKNLQRRIKQLGGKAEALPAVPEGAPDVVADVAGAATTVASKAVAAAKGPLHALRGTGEAEKMLKNAKTEYWNEHEEIATYHGIETLAAAVGDKETQKLAREHRRQEERMASFLEKEIPKLTKAVVQEEIPRDQRAGGTRRRRTTKRRSTSKSTSKSTARRSTASRSKSSRSASSRSGSRRSSASKRSGPGRSTGSSRARSTRAGGGRSSSSRSTARRSSGRRRSSSS